MRERWEGEREPLNNPEALNTFPLSSDIVQQQKMYSKGMMYVYIYKDICIYDALFCVSLPMPGAGMDVPLAHLSVFPVTSFGSSYTLSHTNTQAQRQYYTQYISNSKYTDPACIIMVR